MFVFGWVGSALASCAATCACTACGFASKEVMRRSARLAYCFLFTVAMILAWVLRDFAKPVMEKLPCENPCFFPYTRIFRRSGVEFAAGASLESRKAANGSCDRRDRLPRLALQRQLVWTTGSVQSQSGQLRKPRSLTSAPWNSTPFTLMCSVSRSATCRAVVLRPAGADDARRQV